MLDLGLVTFTVAQLVLVESQGTIALPVCAAKGHFGSWDLGTTNAKVSCSDNGYAEVRVEIAHNV